MHALPCLRRSLATLLLAACSPPPNEGVDVGELRKEYAATRAQLDAVRQRLAAQAPRAAAFRALEFLGDQPPLAGPLTAVEVLDRPLTPDPQTSEYPDCTAVFRCRRIDPAGDRADLLLVVPLFHDRALCTAADFGVGTRFVAQLVPWDEMPETSRAIQRIDETTAFDLPLFAVVGPELQLEEHDVEARPPDGAAPSQADAIAASIAAIQARLAAHGSFEQWHKQLQSVRDELWTKIRAAHGQIERTGRFVMKMIWSLTHEPNAQWPAPQLAYFVALRDQLAAVGIDLIVVPFTERELVTALQVLDHPPADGIVHAYREAFHLQLLQAGIEVVDLQPALAARFDEFPNVFYDAEDGHPADGAIQIAAHEIAARLRRYGELRPVATHFHTRQTRYRIPDQFERFPARTHRQASYTATCVSFADDRPLPRSAPDGPILLLGDSFSSVPYAFGPHCANVAAHLTKETGVLVRHLMVASGGPQLMVHLAREGRAMTEGVRVCVYVFRENYLWQSSETETKFHWQVVELPH